MKNTYLFAKRNTKEILRDPLNLCFGLGFPLILLVLLSIINASIPPEAGNTMFEINNLSAGIAMFGTVFMALFAGMLLAKDRSSSFLMRLFASPMKSTDYILGYTAPLILIALGQSTITLLFSLVFGLPFTGYILLAILMASLTSILFVGLGLLCGCLLNDKTVGGVCGALLTNLAGWLSGVFIPIDLIGGVFKTICHILPFYHGVETIKTAYSGNLLDMLFHFGVVLVYAAVIYVIAILAFKKTMRGKK